MPLWNSLGEYEQTESSGVQKLIRSLIDRPTHADWLAMNKVANQPSPAMDAVLDQAPPTPTPAPGPSNAQEAVMQQFGGDMGAYNRWWGGLQGRKPTNWQQAQAMLAEAPTQSTAAEPAAAMTPAPMTMPAAGGGGTPAVMGEGLGADWGAAGPPTELLGPGAPGDLGFKSQYPNPSRVEAAFGRDRPKGAIESVMSYVPFGVIPKGPQQPPAPPRVQQEYDPSFGEKPIWHQPESMIGSISSEMAAPQHALGALQFEDLARGENPVTMQSRVPLGQAQDQMEPMTLTEQNERWSMTGDYQMEQAGQFTMDPRQDWQNYNVNKALGMGEDPASYGFGESNSFNMKDASRRFQTQAAKLNK